ncbi:MAG: hypothetical protein QXE78_10140 [Nitrososphaeria archaeon]
MVIIIVGISSILDECANNENVVKRHIKMCAFNELVFENLMKMYKVLRKNSNPIAFEYNPVSIKV